MKHITFLKLERVLIERYNILSYPTFNSILFYLFIFRIIIFSFRRTVLKILIKFI